MVWAFAGSIVMRDKLSGNLETLLAAPLQRSELWLGKTLILSLISIGIGTGVIILLFASKKEKVVLSARER